MPPFPGPPSPTVLVGWTTLPDEATAHRMAHDLVAQGLARCAQVEGPLTSVYLWEGKRETSVEYRVTVKFLADRALPLENWLEAHHPYQVPQWVAVPAQFVGGKYLSWLQEVPKV